MKKTIKIFAAESDLQGNTGQYSFTVFRRKPLAKYIKSGFYIPCQITYSTKEKE